MAYNQFSENLLRYARESAARVELVRRGHELSDGEIPNPDRVPEGYSPAYWLELCLKSYANQYDWFGLPELPDYQPAPPEVMENLRAACKR